MTTHTHIATFAANTLPGKGGTTHTHDAEPGHAHMPHLAPWHPDPNEVRPACPACGSDNLRVVYRADVIQRVAKWTPSPGHTTWTVAEYAEAEVDFESTLEDPHVECGECAADVMVPPTTVALAGVDDVFQIVEPQERDSLGVVEREGHLDGLAASDAERDAERDGHLDGSEAT